MNVYLEVSHNKANIKRVVLKKTAILGRSKECNLRIASTQVSRRHCQVTVENETVFVMDLKSSNGTFLNGKPLPANQRVEVTPGSELAIGPARFVFRFETESGVVTGPGSTVDAMAEQETRSATETAGDTLLEEAPENQLEFLAASADTLEEHSGSSPALKHNSAVGRPMPRMQQPEPESPPGVPEELAQAATISFDPGRDAQTEAFELDLGDDIDEASGSEIAAFAEPVADEVENVPPVVAEEIPAAAPVEDDAVETLESFNLVDEPAEPPPAPKAKTKKPVPPPKPAKQPAPKKSDDQVAFDFLNDAGEETAADDSSLGDFFSQFDK